MSEYRVGTGFDAHALEEGVPLVLGGVPIDHPRGLAGHSDGDVLAHALTDAVLGAATAAISYGVAVWLARVRPAAWSFSRVPARATA